jgi:hypothetical protein
MHKKVIIRLFLGGVKGKDMGDINFEISDISKE